MACLVSVNEEKRYNQKEAVAVLGTIGKDPSLLSKVACGFGGLSYCWKATIDRCDQRLLFCGCNGAFAVNHPFPWCFVQPKKGRR